jgi:hypothetical protein
VPRPCGPGVGDRARRGAHRQGQAGELLGLFDLHQHIALPGLRALFRHLRASKFQTSNCRALSVHGSNSRALPQVTGFTNTEEEAEQKTKLVPFLLEDRLKELGGLFERGADWAPHAVRDGQLVTGQNPQSSGLVAELVLEAVAPGIEPQHGKGEGFHSR